MGAAVGPTGDVGGDPSRVHERSMYEDHWFVSPGVPQLLVLVSVLVLELVILL